MAKFYVYVLARPDKPSPEGWPHQDCPFYVGKGTGRRIREHENEARRGHLCFKCQVIRKVWNSGGQIDKYIMLETDDEQEAFAYEVKLIALYGKENLTNLTGGGRGGSAGTTPSPEARAKRSISLKRIWSNPDHRARVAASSKIAMSNPDLRAKRRIVGSRPENIEKLRSAQKLANEPEAKAKQIEKLRGRKLSPEHRANLSASLRRPELVEQIRAKQLKTNRTPETRARRSAAASNRSPESRAKLSASQRSLSAEVQARKADAVRAYFATPEGREHQRQAALARWTKYRARIADQDREGAEKD